MHDADHAGDVKHRYHHQYDIFSRTIAPHAAGNRVVHDAAVGVHTTLGQTGSAAGVGQDGQISWSDLQCRQLAIATECFNPVNDLPCLQVWQGVTRKQPRVPGRWRGIVTGRGLVKRIGEVRHDQVLQLVRGGQRIAGTGQFIGQVRRGDGNPGVRVRDVVLELFGPVHGVNRHHHRIGPQNGKVGNDQLRAVLHAQHNPVALFDPQPP